MRAKRKILSGVSDPSEKTKLLFIWRIQNVEQNEHVNMVNKYREPINIKIFESSVIHVQYAPCQKYNGEKN